MADCGSCRFFRRAEIGMPGGVCRRVPPVPVMAGMLKHPITQELFPAVKTYWPEIPDTEWCGEYVQRPFSQVDLEKLDEADLKGSA